MSIDVSGKLARLQAVEAMRKARKELKDRRMDRKRKYSLKTVTHKLAGIRPFKMSEAEVDQLRVNANAFREDKSKLAIFIETEAIVMLQVDAKLGSEPWRLKGNAGSMISAQSRARFIEQAGRLLADIRGNLPKKPDLLEGVLDGVVDETPLRARE